MNQLREQIEAINQQPSRPRRRPKRSPPPRHLADFHSESRHHSSARSRKSNLLHLAAQVGLPPQMLDLVKTIPVPAEVISYQTVAQKQTCDQLCNLQTDTSGVAKPGARQTGVGRRCCASQCIAMTGKPWATIGVGAIRQHEYTAEETVRLEEIANYICHAPSLPCLCGGDSVRALISAMANPAPVTQAPPKTRWLNRFSVLGIRLLPRSSAIGRTEIATTVLPTFLATMGAAAAWLWRH